MIGKSSLRPAELPDFDEGNLDLDDPFIGLLGQKTGRDELWLGKTVPRYTSYPPATAFRDDFTPRMYEDALKALSPEQPVSFYMHVPFCRALCLYCGCNTCATQQHERVTNYMGFVHREIENIALSAERERKISHLHFGGGSPNILSEKDFGLLFGSLARRFDMSGCDEIAMELDPRLVTKAQAKVLGLLGVTRVSLGVQDFDPNVQHIIGRKQSYELVKAACNDLREAGVRNICFDLMYGLPLQSPASLAETARDAVSLRPNRISLFSYAHVPQVKKHQRALEQYILPGPHACVAMESAARHVLREAGYVEVGMDHFALPADPLSIAAVEGRLQRNFQGYSDDKAEVLLGIGASSIGHLPGAYFQNVRSTDDYEAKIRADGFATTRGLVLTGEDRLRAAVIESLMCSMAVNLEKLCRQYNYALTAFTDELEALKPFEEAGLVRRSGYKIFLTTPYRMAVRVIASLFDKTVRQADAPVSRAV